MVATIPQLVRFKRRRTHSHCWSPALRGNPQLRGRFLRLIINTPRKPNSAKRRVGQIYLSNGLRIRAKVSGSTYMPNKLAAVLVRGGGHKDTPGISYTVIRGALECLPIFTKTRRRSIYGVEKSKEL